MSDRLVSKNKKLLYKKENWYYNKHIEINWTQSNFMQKVGGLSGISNCCKFGLLAQLVRATCSKTVGCGLLYKVRFTAQATI